jgi:hypothetical protein
VRAELFAFASLPTRRRPTGFAGAKSLKEKAKIAFSTEEAVLY